MRRLLQMQMAAAFRKKVKTSLAFGAAVLLALGAVTISPARAAVPGHARDTTYSFDIPAQSLNDALQALALASQHKLLCSSELVEGKSSSAIKGELTTEQAVRQLLAGTDLAYEVADGLVLIRAKDAKLPAASGGRAEGSAQLEIDRKGGITLAQARNGTEDADAGAAGDASRSSADSKNSAKSSAEKSQEIVVTARKREERIQDVPVPVAVISGDWLARNNQVQLKDYYSKLPGVNLTVSAVDGTPNVTIRGLSTGAGAALVAYVVDDVTYGASHPGGGLSTVPDFDPSDLARVEVLRGPQGTLYGASSVGGLVKFTTVDPTTAGLTARVQVGSSVVSSGAVGYSARGAVNVPLGETFAVRLSGFARRDPGYIDDPVRGNDVNKVDTNGALLLAMWRPTENFSWKISALVQDTHAYGMPYEESQLGIGELRQATAPGTEWSKTKMDSYSSTLVARLGRASLTVLSGFNSLDGNTMWDFTDFFPWAVLNDNTYKKFTQEARLSIPIGKSFEWLIGAYYTREKVGDADLEQVINFGDMLTGAGDWLFAQNFGNTFREHAAFTTLSFHATDRFDIQLGVRQSNLKSIETLTTPFADGTAAVSPDQVFDETPFTYLLAPSFKITPDLMVYARAASGYRPGGGSKEVHPLIGAPTEFESDKAQNYEFGMKGDVLGDVLSFDASLYYIDWTDVQVPVAALPGFNIGRTANAGKAKSQGIELSVEARPLTGLAMSAWVVWNDAVLKDDILPLNALAGDRLPRGSRFSGNFSIDQSFHLTDGMSASVGGSLSYIGDRAPRFRPNLLAPQPTDPSYARVDLRAGIKKDSWSVDAFVNNLTDKRGLLTEQILGPSSRLIYIQPRTAGLLLTRTF